MKILFVADGTSEFHKGEAVAIHARLGEPGHAHATDFRGFFWSEIDLWRRRGFPWRADVAARQCSHFRNSPFWLWLETSSCHRPKWGRSRNASHRQKGPSRIGGFVDALWPGASYDCAPSVCRTPPRWGSACTDRGMPREPGRPRKAILFGCE